MGSLVETIKDMDKRKAVVDDCVKLIDAEVASKRGVSGIAIKAAFKVVKGFQPGMIPMSMNHLLDDFAAQIDPFWQECQSEGSQSREFFTRRKGDVANALLSITDGRASKSRHRSLVKAYNKLRPQAVNHIGDAMPRLADVIQKHAS